MSGKRTSAFVGLHVGPYTVGAETAADIPVTAINQDGNTVVVGRFPSTKAMDARAQAEAYAALPELVSVIRAVFMAYPDIENNEEVSPSDLLAFMALWQREARAALNKAGIP